MGESGGGGGGAPNPPPPPPRYLEEGAQGGTGSQDRRVMFITACHIFAV